MTDFGDLFVLGGLGLLLAGLGRQAKPLPPLPEEPYSYTDLPFRSNFEEKSLEPFQLLSVFGGGGRGDISFTDDGYLLFHGGDRAYVVTRISPVNKLYLRYVWKAVQGSLFVLEAWKLKEGIGNTSMISFTDGKVFQSQYPDQKVLVAEFDPFKDWVTVLMEIDYENKEIVFLSVNELTFEHLPFFDEPCDWMKAFAFNKDPYIQIQLYVPAGSVLVKEISAWSDED
jgi:hypothetical protein